LRGTTRSRAPLDEGLRTLCTLLDERAIVDKAEGLGSSSKGAWSSAGRSVNPFRWAPARAPPPSKTFVSVSRQGRPREATTRYPIASPE
jgi:hypothetical protein